MRNRRTKKASGLSGKCNNEKADVVCFSLAWPLSVAALMAQPAAQDRLIRDRIMP